MSDIVTVTSTKVHISVERDDGTGGDLPGWYVRRTMKLPFKVPPGGGVSIAGPFASQAEAEVWLYARLGEPRDPQRLAGLLPIPPAASMAKQPDPDQESGEADVARMRGFLDKQPKGRARKPRQV